MATDLLTSADAARRLGVSPSSIKRWADSGVLPCVVTPGGHRRFAADAVEALRKRGPSGPDVPAGSDDSPEDAPGTAWADALLVEGDSILLEALLLDARGRLGSWWGVAGELALALAELGQRWTEDRVSILDEHRASERLARALARWSEGLVPRAGAPRILLALAEGEHHALGLRLAELCLREAGWHVQWAGERTPVTEVLDAIRTGGLDAVGLSAAASHLDPHDLAVQARALEAACQRAGVTLLLGGGGPWPADLARAVRLRTIADLHFWLEAERNGEIEVKR